MPSSAPPSSSGSSTPYNQGLSQPMHVTAIIAAGGRGQRFGAAQPKQLLPVGGRAILERSIDAFASHPDVSELVVALPQSLVDDPPAYLRSTEAFALKFSGKSLRIVAGGDRRQDSVAKAFAAAAAASDIIVIHDAARPFASAVVDIGSFPLEQNGLLPPWVVVGPFLEEPLVVVDESVLVAYAVEDQVYLEPTRAGRAGPVQEERAAGNRGVEVTGPERMKDAGAHVGHGTQEVRLARAVRSEDAGRRKHPDRRSSGAPAQ